MDTISTQAVGIKVHVEHGKETKFAIASTAP